MQKLHLVGFTPDLDGLILSTRKGARSGSFVVAVDATILKQLAEANKSPEPATRANGLRQSAGPRESRPESQLGPREMQELLRGGWTLEEVAVEAGVDVDWVSRFAAPVLAEMRRVLDQALDCVFFKPRVGPSALPLAASVRRNAAERGVRFTDEDFEDAWRAAQFDDVVWIVGFDYPSRGKQQSAEWTMDLELGEVTSRNRLGTQLGYVQSARRKVDTTPPPKPKPKAAAARAIARAKVATPQSPPPAARRRPSPAPSPVRSRSRASSGGPKKSSKTASSGRKSSKPHAEAPPEPRRDPWRDELRRRELERSAALAARPPAPAPERAPQPEPAPAPEEDLRPVAIIGPTIRRLARRRATPILGAPIHQVGGPLLQERVVSVKGPLPAPGPLAVPEEIRDRVASPLGGDDDDDDDIEPAPALPVPAPLAPSAPVFRGAEAASTASSVQAPARRRRGEPLRAR